MRVLRNDRPMFEDGLPFQTFVRTTRPHLVDLYDTAHYAFAIHETASLRRSIDTFGGAGGIIMTLNGSF
jgi:hypothetical protein